jgi:hypothetical protein
LLLVIMLASVFFGGAAHIHAQDETATPEPPVRATLDISGSAKDVIAQLKEANLVPGGGTYYDTQNLYIQVASAGKKFLSVFDGVYPQNFVLQFEVQLKMQSDAVAGSGCGFMFRTSDYGYGTVLLTMDRSTWTNLSMTCPASTPRSMTWTATSTPSRSSVPMVRSPCT